MRNAFYNPIRKLKYKGDFITWHVIEEAFEKYGKEQVAASTIGGLDAEAVYLDKWSVMSVKKAKVPFNTKLIMTIAKN